MGKWTGRDGVGLNSDPQVALLGCTLDLDR